MAVNQSRSMNAELHEGATDGVFKKVAPDRGGVVEHTFVQGKRDLSPYYYGSVIEAESKSIGDGTVRSTPGRIDMPNACGPAAIL